LLEEFSMARRNDSILNVLVTFPWHVNVAFALALFFGFKYVLPVIPVENPFLEGILHKILPNFAPILALVLLVVAGVSALNAMRKGRLLESQKGIESIRSISWQHFEELVGEAFRRKGYHVTETGGGGADGGVDLVLRKGGETFLVQCKNWRTYKVGVKVVRELYGIMAAQGATGGFVIISGKFTQEAKEFARDKALELVDGTQLVKMIEEVRRTPPILTVSEPEEEDLCPRCGSEMVLRVATKGPRSGERFWGCSAFPKCRGARALHG
jgi:restriction system protein